MAACSLQWTSGQACQMTDLSEHLRGDHVHLIQQQQAPLPAGDLIHHLQATQSAPALWQPLCQVTGSQLLSGIHTLGEQSTPPLQEM